MDDDKFLAEWETAHNKGMISYLLKNIFPSLAGILLIDSIFLIKGPLKAETINNMIFFFVCFIFFTLLFGIIRWYRSEQRYKKIVKLCKGATYEKNHEEV